MGQVGLVGLVGKGFPYPTSERGYVGQVGECFPHPTNPTYATHPTPEKQP
jgi:hypothetical protein